MLQEIWNTQESGYRVSSADVVVIETRYFLGSGEEEDLLRLPGYATNILEPRALKGEPLYLPKSTAIREYS